MPVPADTDRIPRPHPVTLAQLYAIAEDRETGAPATEGFGFPRALTR
jgi:hypothetical protein